MPEDLLKEAAPDDASKEDVPKEDETEEARQRRCARGGAPDDAHRTTDATDKQ